MTYLDRSSHDSQHSAHNLKRQYCISGLVDAGCRIAGYRESLLQDISLAPRQIAMLLSSFGVVAVRDQGSGVDALYRFRNAAGSSILVIGGGPVLVEGKPQMEGDRPISSEEDIRRSLDALYAEQIEWISVLPESIEFLEAVSRLAGERGMKISARGKVAVEGALKGLVNLIEGIASLSEASERRDPHVIVESFREGETSRLCARLKSLADRGVAMTTELIALRRAVFVKESLSAPYLEELEPIMPHSRYLRQMRQAGGYLIGKRALEKYAGLKEPTGANKQRIAEGWSRLMEVAACADDLGVTLFPSTRSPQLAVVPGYSLLEEMALLVHAGLSAVKVLSNASDRAKKFFAIRDDNLRRVTLQASKVPSTPEDILSLSLA